MSFCAFSNSCFERVSERGRGAGSVEDIVLAGVVRRAKVAQGSLWGRVYDIEF